MDEREERQLKRRQNQNRIELNASSRVFTLSEEKEAKEHAFHTRSYIDRCFNGYEEWVGYFVPL